MKLITLLRSAGWRRVLDPLRDQVLKDPLRDDPLRDRHEKQREKKSGKTQEDSEAKETSLKGSFKGRSPSLKGCEDPLRDPLRDRGCWRRGGRMAGKTAAEENCRKSKKNRDPLKDAWIP